MREEITFSRNAEAIMIPSGEKVLVPKGAQATITQSLGGTYTLITDRGLMVRVSGVEVEAIGKAPQETAGVKPDELTPEKLEELVWEALKTCYDPEIPVNIDDYMAMVEDAQDLCEDVTAEENCAPYAAPSYDDLGYEQGCSSYRQSVRVEAQPFVPADELE